HEELHLQILRVERSFAVLCCHVPLERGGQGFGTNSDGTTESDGFDAMRGDHPANLPRADMEELRHVFDGQKPLRDPRWKRRRHVGILFDAVFTAASPQSRRASKAAWRARRRTKARRLSGKTDDPAGGTVAAAVSRSSRLCLPGALFVSSVMREGDGAG